MTVDKAATARELYKKPLSELIRICVADAQKIENTPGYKLDMGTFHSIYREDYEGSLILDSDEQVLSDDTCYVCMGGAVLSQSLSAPFRTIDVSRELSEEAKNVVFALDRVRQGCLFDALDYLNRDYTHKQGVALEFCKDLIEEDYGAAGSRADWDTYLKVAGVLEVFGL